MPELTIASVATLRFLSPQPSFNPGPVGPASQLHGLGRPFRPRNVVFVSQLPKTRNQKIMRRLVRAVFTGDALGDLSSLVNPEALEELRRVVDLGNEP